jgi:hypothetical protein
MSMTDDTSYNTTYAQLAQGDKARGCARELRRGQLIRPHMKLVVSSTRRGHAELPLALTHTWGGLLRGILFGGGVGLIAAMLLGLLEESASGHPINWALVKLLALLGALMGCLAGGLAGSMNPLPKIDRMEKEGDVVVAVESDDTSDLEWAARVLQKWGADPHFRTSRPAW